MSDPVFLLASERSGTNLLRRRLTGCQRDLFGPSPTHMLKHLYFAEPYYGDLSTRKNFEAMTADALGLAYHHFAPWEIKLTPEDVRDAYPEIMGGEPCVIGIMHVLYTLYARAMGYRTYFCKDNNLFDFVLALSQALPRARFLYLYRDPRDVVLSQLKRPLQNKSVVYLSRIRRDEQVKCIACAHGMTTDDEVVRLAYEDLIADESSVIAALCADLGVRMVDDRGERSDEDGIGVHEWKNLDQPTIVGNSGKYTSELSTRQIREIEAVCWHQMEWLGYRPLNDTRPRLGRRRAAFEALASRAFGVLQALRSSSAERQWRTERNRYIRKLRTKWQ